MQIHLAVLVFSSVVYIVGSTVIFIKREEFKDKTSELYTLFTLDGARSVIICAIQCAVDLACVSFFYNKYSKVCRAKSVLFNISSDVQIENGSSYFSVFQEGCPVDFIRNRKYDLCYKPFVTMVTSASQANAACTNNGYVLVRARTVDAYLHIADQLMVTQDNGWPEFFIDGNDVTMNGDWRFSNGEKMTAFIWGENEPNYEANYAYLHLHKNYFGKYEMSNINYSFGAYYICQVL